MNILKKVIRFFERIFNKENSVKMIDAPVENLKKDNKSDFLDSLKVDVVLKHKKKKIETLTCIGDGLGIQTKIGY